MISSSLESISEIEPPLFWKEPEEKTSNRTPLFNLIFVYSSPEKKADCHTLWGKTLDKVPAHALWVRTNLDLASQEKLPFLILSHLSSDLPIYVIWTDNPTPSPFLLFLQSIATKMIFDAKEAPNLQEFAQSLLAIQASPSRLSHIADLHWVRIENWRNLLISCFHTPEKFSSLQECAQLIIHYNRKESTHPSSQALYLQGWLATQLEWELCAKKTTGSTLLLTYQTPQGKKVEVVLISEEEPRYSCGTVLSLSLTTHTQLHLLCVRGPKTPHQIKAIFSTPHHCELPLFYTFSEENFGFGLSKEIYHKPTSRHYLRLLERISRGDLT